MNDDLYNIDDLFKKALEEHTELPSSAVWNTIDKSLDKKKVVSISKKYNKLKWVAAVLLLFSIGMAMYTIHVRIKNKELVREHPAKKNRENQKKETRNNPEESSGPAVKNNHNITAINKSNLPKDKNTADDLNTGNKKMQFDPGIKFPSDEKAAEHITKQNQKKLMLKDKSPITIQENSAGIDPVNNRKGNHVESIIPNNDRDDIAVNKELQGNRDENFVLAKEKYINSIGVTANLKDRLQTLTTKPVSQIPAVPAINNGAFKEDKIPLKHNKRPSIQQRNLKNSGNSLLSATLFFSPDLVSTNVKNEHPLFREEDSHEIKKDEKTKSSYAIGVLIDYNTGKNWKLESGVTFSTRFTDIEPKTIYARPDNNGNINYRFNCSAGYSYVTLKSPGPPPAYGDSISALTSKNVLQYIGVPLVVKYLFGTGRFSLAPGVGISANFLTKGKIETTIPATTGNEKVTSNDIQGLKSTYLSGLASMGVQYKLNRTFELTFIPTARFALSPINREAPVKTYLNSIGFATGIIIKL
jgi:hypothetical protein